MNWTTLAISVYGAALSTALAILAWRRERRKLSFSQRFIKGSHGNRLEIGVFNPGHRPVTLSSAYLAMEPNGGYLPGTDTEFGLPRKLEEGDWILFTFEAEDLADDTTAFVVISFDREYRHDFDAQIRTNWANHTLESA